MILYFYMMLQMMLSLVLVGSFYGSFSIFLRAILPSDKCLSITRTANVLENIYLIFLFMVIIMSTTVSIDWAETGFRVCSVVMGLFTLLMVACSIAYAFQATLASISVIFISIYILSFALPLLMNASHLKICDFLKGVLYSIYLTPTYINIFTIYAISNIHDVTWGSRPSVFNPAFKATEDKKQVNYKNYRSNFLVVWLIVNVIVGFLIVYISRSGQYVIMLIFGIFLMIVLSLKLIFAILHWFKAKHDSRNANALKRTKTSNVFNNLDKQIFEDDVFQVYHEIEEQNNIIKNPKDRESDRIYETSVEGKDICMGFDVAKELEKYKQAQEDLLRQSLQKLIVNRKFPKIKSVKELYQIQEESNEEEKRVSSSYDDYQNNTGQSFFQAKNIQPESHHEEIKRVRFEDDRKGAEPFQSKRKIEELESSSEEVDKNDIHLELNSTDLENQSPMQRRSLQANQLSEEAEEDLKLEDESDQD